MYLIVFTILAGLVSSLGFSTLFLLAKLKRAELGLSESRELMLLFAHKLLLERTDGSDRAIRAIQDFCHYNPPDLVIAQALASAPIHENEECE